MTMHSPTSRMDRNQMYGFVLFLKTLSWLVPILNKRGGGLCLGLATLPCKRLCYENEGKQWHLAVPDWGFLVSPRAR